MYSAELCGLTSHAKPCEAPTASHFAVQIRVLPEELCEGFSDIFVATSNGKVADTDAAAKVCFLTLISFDAVQGVSCPNAPGHFGL